LSILGRGNSGQVHRALHKPTGQVIALKAINIMDRDNRHQLLKEIRTLNDCDSPFLVKFLGAFYSDPAISIALELMDAGSLETVLEAAPRRRMPERIAAIVARQMVEGLAYLHRKHMLHRDIKLSNVCLSRRGEVKLTDFGISTQLQNSIAVCATFVGTYTYMSPERIIGKEYSYASDVWSLGLIVLESVMGEFPYPDNGVVIHLMKTVVEGPPEIPKDLSPDLRSFCEQCLRTNAAERASAADLLRHPFIAGLADPAKYQPELADWLKSVLKPEERASAPRR
jgi:serine/threonine protein kinase